MRRRQRQEYVHQRAYELAATGLHIEPITIISEIVREGYPEAASLLDNDVVRQDLRSVCARHWVGNYSQVTAPAATVEQPTTASEEAPSSPPKRN